MAETSKVNHDHTYDILTCLMNVCPSSPEIDSALLGMTSPQPSDTSSDSGLALSPMEFEGFDIDFGDTSTLDTFDLETISSGCSPTSTDPIFDNIGDINDIDLSFLDGFDSKNLESLPETQSDITELPEENMTMAPDLESFIKLMDVDMLVPDEGIDMTTPSPDLAPSSILPPSPPLSPPVSPLSTDKVMEVPVMKTIATVTPIMITQIKTGQNVPARTPSKRNQKLVITEEEKQLLEEEGHVLPENVALTKDEEKLLKRVRRKIKNKVSAQESRRKKKDYIDGLELRVKCCTNENRTLQKKVENLEEQNKTLLEQLKKLQEIVSSSNNNKKQTSTCILVLFLAFALVAFPFNTMVSTKDTSVADSYATLPVRSRTLLQYNEAETEPPSRMNISDYLRAFSIVFSFSSDSPEVVDHSYSKPAAISFDDSRHVNEEGYMQALSK